jgi:hypothetical protein
MFTTQLHASHDCVAGRLTAASLCQALAALQPPDCVLVDESLTSGAVYWEVSKVRTGAS